MQIGAGLIRMSATHSLQIASTEHFFLLKNFVLLQIYFYFPIFEKYNSKIGEFSSRIIHSGTSHCPGMDLAGTWDISLNSGTVPGNPGHLITLGPGLGRGLTICDYHFFRIEFFFRRRNELNR